MRHNDYLANPSLKEPDDENVSIAEHAIADPADCGLRPRHRATKYYRARG
jgi:hypothetical protein